VIDITPLNVTSIKIVEPELNITVQNASRHFEAFMSDRSAVDQLKESELCLIDIVGILKMLQIPGALLLAEEMLRLLRKIIANPAGTKDFSLSALSQGFVAMPCYIEYVVDCSRAMPILTLEFINELRSALRDPIILESQLLEYTVAANIKLAAAGKSAADDLKSLISRQRQMYQIGLIGLIREENLQLKMQLMHRAMSRIADAVGSADNRTQWRLGEAVLEAMLSKDLALTFTRKRTLSLIDAELRNFEQNPDNSAVSDNKALLTELVYLVNVSGCTLEASTEVSKTLSLAPLAITDRLVQKEKAIMHGPNADTMIAMVLALREDLAQSKEILEIASQDPAASTDFGLLVGVFQRTADILAVIGLSTSSQTLAAMSKSVQSCINGEAFNQDNLLEIADGLLYVESALSNLSRLDLNFQKEGDDETVKRRLMAKSQLNEAEAIVIKEAQAGIAQAKKDINSFIESNFEVQHISNVVENLSSIKGGLAILNRKKAVAVVASCIKFIEATISQGVDSSKAQNILETMADALIALEYYLSEVELHGDAHPSVLGVAEQSLAALGFPVSA
jgi:hypothetical protein